MKTLKILFVMCIMLAFAAPVKSQIKQVERPMKCSLYARVTESYGTYEILSITGNATHFGNIAGSWMKFTKPSSTTTPFIEGVLMAANGDCVTFYSYPTMILTDPLHESGTLGGKMYFTGGTGRFEGCTGEGNINGIFSMSEDYAMWTTVGTINY
jgi:hypothetical protein